MFFSHQIGSFFSIQFAGYAYEWFGNSYFWPFLIAGLTLIPAAIMAYSIKEYHYFQPVQFASGRGRPAVGNGRRWRAVLIATV